MILPTGVHVGALLYCAIRLTSWGALDELASMTLVCRPSDSDSVPASTLISPATVSNRATRNFLAERKETRYY